MTFPTLSQQPQMLPALKLINIGDIQLATRYFRGEGIPIVFVHGSWDDHHSWLSIAENLHTKIKNPVIVYDRRGHSASTPDDVQGTISQDVKDAVLLTKALGFQRAHFIGHSYGANIVIQVAQQFPETAESIALYEPPLFGMLKNKAEYQQNLQQVQSAMKLAKSLLEQGNIEQGTIEFIEHVAFGQDSWNNIFDDRARATMLASYRTWLDQANDPERLNIKLQHLNDFKGKITIIHGTESLAVYQFITQELDQAIRNKYIVSISGAGHAGIVSHSNQTAKIIMHHLNASEASANRADNGWH